MEERGRGIGVMRRQDCDTCKKGKGRRDRKNNDDEGKTGRGQGTRERGKEWVIGGKKGKRIE